LEGKVHFKSWKGDFNQNCEASSPPIFYVHIQDISICKAIEKKVATFWWKPIMKGMQGYLKWKTCMEDIVEWIRRNGKF